MPLLDYIAPRFGSQAMLVGSNYIWGWETQPIARTHSPSLGGEVLGERFCRWATRISSILIDEVREKKPDFILNNLDRPVVIRFPARASRSRLKRMIASVR